MFFVLQAEFSLGQFCESHFDDFHGWHFCSSCGHQLQEIFDAEDTTDVQMEMPLPSGFPSSMGFHELAMQLEWQQNQRQFLDIPPIFKNNIFCRSLTLARLPKGIMKDSSTLKKIQIKRTCFCFAPQESTGKNKKQPTKQTNKPTFVSHPFFAHRLESNHRLPQASQNGPSRIPQKLITGKRPGTYCFFHR